MKRRKMLWAIAAIAVFVSATALASQLLKPTPHGPAIAPNPTDTPEAVIQVYGADVWGFRGFFAIHTWVATKAAYAATYNTYQVIGWHLRQRGTVLSITQGPPDRPWFRSPPILLYERRGTDVDSMVQAVHQAALSYPHQQEYTMWPGPNSNSFTEWVALSVPELELELPAKAIGKSWMQSNYLQ